MRPFENLLMLLNSARLVFLYFMASAVRATAGAGVGPYLLCLWRGLMELLVAVAYAALDEWHQSFVPLREARVRDVATDALGALLAQTLVWIYSGLKKPHSAEAVTLRSHPPSLKE